MFDDFLVGTLSTKIWTVKVPRISLFDVRALVESSHFPSDIPDGSKCNARNFSFRYRYFLDVCSSRLSFCIRHCQINAQLNKCPKNRCDFARHDITPRNVLFYRKMSQTFDSTTLSYNYLSLLYDVSETKSPGLQKD